MNPFDQKLRGVGRFPLRAGEITTVQANISLVCNLQCTHCHWSCGPGRTEVMDWATMESIATLVRQTGARQVDITGGEPSSHPNLRRFIDLLRREVREIRLRTNLVGLDAELGQFFRDRGVRLIGSLPCYRDTNVDSQRGSGTFARSIEQMRMLNDLGYARDDDLTLDLVCNPAGAELPGDQAGLQQDYRRRLRQEFGVEFNSLLTITNVPIGRFAADLHTRGAEDNYQQLLQGAFNAETLESLMCRNQICVGWDGSLADCDFNLALGHAADVADRDPGLMPNRRIVTGQHCFACAAGNGSSCSGALL
jgi:radical SAM/Cys-rich protein